MRLVVAAHLVGGDRRQRPPQMMQLDVVHFNYAITRPPPPKRATDLQHNIIITLRNTADCALETRWKLKRSFFKRGVKCARDKFSNGIKRVAAKRKVTFLRVAMNKNEKLNHLLR